MTFGLHINGVDIPVEVDMDVRSAKRSDTSNSMRSLCPDCNEPLHQELACETHGIITPERVVKGSEHDGGYVVVSDEELLLARTPDLASGSFRLHVFDAKSIGTATIETGNVYRLRPSLKQHGNKKLPTPASWLQGYAIVRELVTDRDIAFVVEWTFRNVQKMYRLDVFGEQLVMRELVRPEDISQPDTLELPEIAPALIDGARDGLPVEHFDPEAFADQRRTRVKALLEAKAKGENVVMPAAPQPEQAGGLDLVAALEASLAATSKPKAAKRTTRAA